MTRRVVYATSAVVFLAATVLTLAAIIVPRWISWDTTTSAGTRIHYTYGLHKRCSSISGSCEYFPQQEDCHGPDRYFCSLWRSVGFLMSFAVVLEGMTLAAYIVIIGGGRQKREAGWRALSFMLMFIGVVQCAAMAIMVITFDKEDRFFVGWKLDASWIYCTISWSVLVLSSAAIMLSAWILPAEDGYELIPS